jgi:DNA-binding CsgD family transcriptional regulator
VLLVDPRGRVAHLTPGAADLLAGTPLQAGEALPEPYAGWLRAERARRIPCPLVRGGVVARLVADGVEGFDVIVLGPARPGLPPAGLQALGLTEREAEVIALAADGCTNAEAAARLGIRGATVAKHLQHINEKLGTGSRSAAVARVRELLDGVN